MRCVPSSVQYWTLRDDRVLRVQLTAAEVQLAISVSHSEVAGGGVGGGPVSSSSLSAARSMALPPRVHVDGLRAVYADGVLTIRCPKVAGEDGGSCQTGAPRRVPIE